MASLWPILRLLKPFWSRVMLAVFLSVLTIGSSVGLMMTAAWLISTAALQLGIASLGVAPTAVRFFGLSRALFRYLERLVSHDVTFRLLGRMRVWFYTQLEALSLVQRQSYRSGDLMARVVGDIEELQNFYQRVVGPPVVAILITGLVGLVFSFIDVRAALALVAFMLVAGTALPLFTWWAGRHTGRQVVTQRTNLHSQLVEVIQGLPDSIAYGYALIQQEKLAKMAGRLAQAEEKMTRLDGWQSGLSVILVNLAALSVLWVAVGRVEGLLLASLTLGTIAAFEAITPLAQMGQNLGREETAARRVREIIEHTPAISEPLTPQPPATATPALLFDQVTFRYAATERPVLQDFSLTVPYGTHILITGPSGAGKSSLINILLRFAEYESGQVLVGDTDLRRIAHEEVRHLFGVMSQRTYLFNTTIGENIRLGRKSAGREEVVAAAQAAQVHDFITALPQGYETYVGEGGTLLSGGERQRIALARMLLKDAPIWLLDEPTANLDAVSARKIIETVFAAGKGRTLVIMTHRRQIIDHYHFDRHVRLAGEWVARGKK